MIKRPLNSRFSDKAKADIKITTIRDKAWPIGKPVMLYNWSDKAYRSKQIDVCAVEVIETSPILITRDAAGEMSYCMIEPLPKPLWECEGFESQQDMDAWFSAKMKPGQSIEKQLMHFRRIS
jgi:hypothetical protein